MTQNTYKMWSNGIEIAIFLKNYKKSQNGWGLRPQTPLASSGWGLRSHIPIGDPFELHYFTQLVSQFRRFHLWTFGLNPLPLAKFWSSAKPGHGFWSFILRCLCPTKNSSF